MNSLNKSAETLLAELEIENKIRLELPEVNLYFDFSDGEEKTEFRLVTISKTHGERFLFHKSTSTSRLSCLDDMLKYINGNYKKNLEHYEIIWSKKINSTLGETQKSWFCGSSFLDVMDKFFYLKDTSEIRIFKIKLMPIS
jgi:hypothetical protein